MCVLSFLSLGSTISDLATYMVMAGFLSYAGYSVMELIKKINAVHDFMLKEEDKTNRINEDMRVLEHDLKSRIEKLDLKIDKLIEQRS